MRSTRPAVVQGGGGVARCTGVSEGLQVCVVLAFQNPCLLHMYPFLTPPALPHPHTTPPPPPQAVSRRVAYHTFAHVLDLDIAFHLERRTGRLSRILERGGAEGGAGCGGLLFGGARGCVWWRMLGSAGGR